MSSYCPVLSWLAHLCNFDSRMAHEGLRVPAKAEAERAAQIDQFLSNSAAPVPPGAEQAPIMLTLWNYSKVALFCRFDDGRSVLAPQGQLRATLRSWSLAKSCGNAHPSQVQDRLNRRVHPRGVHLSGVCP
jgi:hypothetical protein